MYQTYFLALCWDFASTAYGFSFVFCRNHVTLNDTLDVSLLNDLSSPEKCVFSMIKNNKKITREEMAGNIGKTIRTIQRITNSLASRGFITRIGNNRFGYWEILK